MSKLYMFKYYVKYNVLFNRSSLYNNYQAKCYVDAWFLQAVRPICSLVHITGHNRARQRDTWGTILEELSLLQEEVWIYWQWFKHFNKWYKKLRISRISINSSLETMTHTLWRYKGSQILYLEIIRSLIYQNLKQSVWLLTKLINDCITHF